MADAYASTNWHAAEGREEDFQDLWRESLTWTKENFKGLERARLLRDDNDPASFVSFIEWESRDARDRWRSHPEFAERYGALEKLCSKVEGSTYAEAVRVA